MTSQSSTNKKSISLLGLMREDLHHKTWMLALSILGSFLAGPVACLFAFSEEYGNRNAYYKIIGDQVFNRQGEFLMTLQELRLEHLNVCKHYLCTYHTILMAIIACIGAAIVAILGFRYLYHKQMVDLYHSAPVTRGKLFTAYWLEGFLIWFVPAFVGSLLVFVELAVYMGGAYLGTIFVTVLLTLLRLSLCFLIVYHVCLVGVMLSGNVLNAILESLTLGLLVFFMTVAVMVLQNVFYSTAYHPDYMQYFHPLYALSPLTTPVLLIYNWSKDSSAIPTMPWHLWGGILLMLVNLALAFFLYQKRRSELSERGLEAKFARIPFRFCISVLGGIFMGLIFHETTRAITRIGWTAFGVLFGTALTFCVLNVIYHVNFKEVISHKLQYVLVLVTTMVIIFGMFFDLTGFDKRLPKKESITGLSLYVNGLNDPDCHVVLTKDGFETKSDWDGPSEGLVSRDAGQIYDFLKACIASEGMKSGRFHRLTVKVSTKLGSYYRSYKISDEYLALLEPLVETKEYTETFYPLKSLKFGSPKMVTLSGSLTTDSFIRDPEKIDMLMNAIHQDFEEHLNLSDLLAKSRLFSLSFRYEWNGGTRSFQYDIPYWYQHTIALVNSWFPNKQWDPDLNEIISLNLYGDLGLLENETMHDALYCYYGFDPNGSALSAPTSASRIYYADHPSYMHWNFTLTDLDFLKELEPYLIWGYYDEGLTLDYISIGTAEFSSYEGRINCYIQYGKLPADLLKAIENYAKTGYYESYKGYDDYAVYPDYYDSFYEEY